jgi:hypothetical protein
MKIMNKKFVWKFKYNKYECVFYTIMLVISLLINSDWFIIFSVSGICYAIAGIMGHHDRIKSGIKDQELPLTKKQMLFIFLLLGLVILLIFFIKQFVTDKTQSIILIYTLALVSGIFALIYVMNVIKKNKNKSKVN